MSLENGEINLIDMENKINTQRIKWTFNLIHLDREDFTKVVAGEVIGKSNAGYEGVDIFKAGINKMKPKVLDPFMRIQLAPVKKLK